MRCARLFTSCTQPSSIAKMRSASWARIVVGNHDQSDSLSPIHLPHHVEDLVTGSAVDISQFPVSPKDLTRFNAIADLHK